VHPKNIFLFITTMILCTGCGGNIVSGKTFTATPDFVTAILPSTLAPQITQTSTLPAPMPTIAEEPKISPIEGTTTTQLNVRAGPSTASESLGLIGPFVKVQVIGRDASGSWYQVIYAEAELGKGWVRAEYVQVNAPAEIQLVEATSGSGAAMSGLVIQKINVRNGPGTEYELLGELNSNDVVFITGKDSGGKWMQIEFANAPDGKGWVTAEFLQTGNIETVPLIGGTADETSTPKEIDKVAMAAMAMQDGDSMQTPLAVVSFSPTGSRILQLNGDVSAPGGDVEDWIQFTTNGNVVAVEVACSNTTLQVKLLNNGKPVDGFVLSCGDKSFVNVTPNTSYFLQLSEFSLNEPGYTNYVLNVEGIR
jgi:uncharacterized protein YraI